MELYPRHFEALGNGRQANMERLNNILGETPQGHQQDAEQRLAHKGFTPGRDRRWRAPGIAHVDAADAYSTSIGADVREEWEDDTADMRYGDWENDANEEYTPVLPRQLPPPQHSSQEARGSIRTTQPLRPQS